MDSKLYNSLAEAYAAVYSDNVEETYTVTAADKKGNTPAYQAFKAGKKKKDGTPLYKAADHMKEGVRDLDPEKGTAERKARLEKKRGMKMDDHPQYKKEEVEMDEAMRPGERQRKVAAKVHDPYVKGGSKTRAIAHNVAVRNDGPGTPGYEKKSTGGKGAKYAGYGDQGAGNKARRRMGQEPLRGNTRKEELEASGLFTEEEINAILEADEQFDEAMSSYDRNRKRAAQRAAERNAARAAGKTGVVPGVGYVSPRKERETYTDEKGTVRHKSGAKMP